MLHLEPLLVVNFLDDDFGLDMEFEVACLLGDDFFAMERPIVFDIV